MPYEASACLRCTPGAFIIALSIVFLAAPAYSTACPNDTVSNGANISDRFGFNAITGAYSGTDRAADGVGKVYSSAPGSVERAAIMEALRLGTHSNSRFLVDHLRVAREVRAKLAYVEVRPADPDLDPYLGWAILATTGSAWHLMYGLGSWSTSSCRLVRKVYTAATEAADLWDVKPHTLFSAKFFAAKAIASRSRGDSECSGAPVFGDDD
jgi:hypothetical protein